MPQITVEITEGQLETLEAVVASGGYSEPAAVLREALSHWEANRWFEGVTPQGIQHLRELWDEGIASGPGEPLDWDKFMQEVQSRAAELKASAA